MAAAVLDLAGLDGSDGFRLDGFGTFSSTGAEVAAAGDLDGDGFADVIVSSPFRNGSRGESYVVFGRQDGFAASIDLVGLDGADGFVLDRGTAVGGAGDVNGDGVEDLALGSDFGGNAFVFFGGAYAISPLIDLDAVDGSDGFRVDGIAANTFGAPPVSGAGDVNGDGLDDIVLGAPYAAPGGPERRGETYVVFGRAADQPAAIDVADLDGSDGFRLIGDDQYDDSGFSVDGAGDLNGDGLDDLVIGARFGDPNGLTNAGESYVVFGRRDGFAASIELAELDGADGFRIDGGGSFERSGVSVSAAGDVNGDGVGDLIVGAQYLRDGTSFVGGAYVVFGQAAGFAASLDVDDLDGTDGFRLVGVDDLDFAGYAVSGVGDFNGDGFDDIVVGAERADVGGDADAGETYLIFGKAAGFGASIDLAGLAGTDGLRLDGIDAEDRSGHAVSGAGDVNGDGFDDLVIGTFGADPDGVNYAGEAYVVFGFDTGAVTNQGGTGRDNLVVDAGASVVLGAQDADILQSNGGPVVLRGGEADDVLIVGDDDFRQVHGGTGVDTLRLRFSVEGLDLTGDSRLRVESVEQIDLLRFSQDLGASVLLDAVGALRLSEVAREIFVVGLEGTAVELEDDGWSLDQAGGGFRQYLNGGAIVSIAQEVAMKVRGGGDADLLQGGVSADFLQGKSGDDELLGEAGNDELFGNSGDDELFGGDGDDRLSGGAGADRMDGGLGDDLFVVDDADDRVSDEGGIDTVLALIAYDLPGAIENLDFSSVAGDVDGQGNQSDNTIIGSDGANRIKASGGDDVVEGQDGDDVLNGQSGDDELHGGDGLDFLTGKEGDDRLFGGADNDQLRGEAGDDHMEGGGAKDRLIGKADADVLIGGEANDKLFGNSGDDVIDGGEGKDVMTGGEGFDVFVLAPGAQVDVIKDFETGVDRLDLTAYGFESFAEVEALMKDKNGRAQINLDGSEDVVRLNGVAVADLDADDFILT